MKYRHGGEYYKGIGYDFSVNTNPLGPPLSIKNRLKEIENSVIKYPAARDYEGLKAGIRTHDGHLTGANIILSNGASELIHNIILMLKPKGAAIISPCFYGYERALRLSGAQLDFIAQGDASNYIRNKKPELLCMCNPANPTGILTKKKELAELAGECKNAGTWLIIDECFLDFIKEHDRYTMADMLLEYPNIIIIRSFTKLYCIPGVRLGYAYVSDKLMDFKPKRYFCEWNVSSVAAALGMAALDCGDDYVKSTYALLAEEREYLKKKLSALGIKEIKGEANYIFFKSRLDLFDALLKKEILIRACDNYTGLSGKYYYRTAIKTHRENEALINALEEIFNNGAG